MNRPGTVFLRMLVACGLAVLLPVGVGWWAAVTAVRESAARESRLRLESVVERRLRVLDGFLAERIADGNVARRSPLLQDALAEVGGHRAPPVRTSRRGPVPPTAAAVARDQLRVLAGLSGCADAFLINTNGVVVLSAFGRPELGGSLMGPMLRDSALTRAVLAARASGQSVLSELRIHRPTGRLAAFVVAPVLGTAPGSQGFLALEIPGAALHQRLAEDSEATRGSEVVLAAADRDHVLLLSPMRDPRAPPPGSAVRAEAIRPDSALGLALRGATGLGAQVDLFGQPIQAWWGEATRLRCAMVVALDPADVEGAARAVRRRLWGFGAVALGLAIGLVWLVARGIAAPLEELARAVDRVGTGGDDQRTGIRTSDEIGRVSEVLDQTLDRLQAALAARGDLERQRLELRQRNTQLEEWVRAMTADRERRGFPPGYQPGPRPTDPPTGTPGDPAGSSETAS